MLGYFFLFFCYMVTARILFAHWFYLILLLRSIIVWYVEWKWYIRFGKDWKMYSMKHVLAEAPAHRNLSLAFCLCLILRISFTANLIPEFHPVTATAQVLFRSFQFLPVFSVLMTSLSHFQLSHSVSVLTVRINPITILPLRLGTGNIFNVFIST